MLLPAIACSLQLMAQHSLTTDITFEGAFGAGDYNAHYITSNRFGSMTTQSNAVSIRAALQGEVRQGRWQYSYGADLIAQRDQYTPVFVQQLYGRAEWDVFYIEAGAREYGPTVRNQQLSSGSTIISGNCRPLPQLKLGTDHWWTIPGTRGWVETFFDGGYGMFTDDRFLEQRYDEYNPGGNTLTGYAQSFITTGALLHQKRLYLRTNPHKRFVFTAGCEHSVQFGGKTVNYVNNTINGEFDSKVSFKDFLKVIMPSAGGDNAAVGDRNFVFGNHLGNLNVTLDWNMDKEHTLSAYYEAPFEDGSGIAKRNGIDGLWGIEYKHPGRHVVHGLVIEYLQTTNQSGAVHWAPQDHLGELNAEARGADEYYNNYYYCGYAHYGQSMGSPMLKSPIYNRDSYLRFTDNRVEAWHFGVEGNLLTKLTSEDDEKTLDYRLLFSYRNSYGTMSIPSAHIRHDLSFLYELIYTPCRHWTINVAYAQDRGSLLGNNYTLDFAIRYHGKLL